MSQSSFVCTQLNGFKYCIYIVAEDLGKYIYKYKVF